MRDFFKGWRRKVGCVTLLMAVLLTTACFRSRACCDSMTFCATEKMYLLSSSDSYISWREEFDPPPIGGVRVWWGTDQFSTVPKLEIPPEEQLKPDFSVSYWFLIAPLTFVSWYLLVPSGRRNNPDA